MKLVNSYILIKVDEVDEKTQGGLYLNPDQVKLPNTGVVEELPANINWKNEHTLLKKGDRVHFLRYASIDGIEEGTRLCKPEHIIAVL